MIRSPAMMMADTIANARLIELTATQVTSWRPSAGLAQPGDLAVLIGPYMPTPAFISAGTIAYKFLTAADMNTTFSVSNGSRAFSIAVFRNVVALVGRKSGYAGEDQIVSGFEKSSRHNGIIVATVIDPNSLVTTPGVKVGAISNLGIMRNYSAPADYDRTANLYAFLYPERTLYADATPFEIDSRSSSYQARYDIWELIAP